MDPGLPLGCACNPLRPLNLWRQFGFDPAHGQGPCRAHGESRSCRRQSWGLPAQGGGRVGPGSEPSDLSLPFQPQRNAASSGNHCQPPGPPPLHIWGHCASGVTMYLGSLGSPGEARLSQRTRGSCLSLGLARQAPDGWLCSVAEAAAHCLLKGSRERRGQEGHEDSGLTGRWERQSHEQEELCVENPELYDRGCRPSPCTC